MFERFTDRARRVVVLAQDRARERQHGYIGSEHLLLGLLQSGGLAQATLESVGVDFEVAAAQLDGLIEHGTSSGLDHIPFTPRSKKVLERAFREALVLGHNYIGTEHLLLGLIATEGGVAIQMLENLGADLGVVRTDVIQRAHEANKSATAPRVLQQARLLTPPGFGPGPFELLLAIARVEPEDAGASRLLDLVGLDYQLINELMGLTEEGLGLPSESARAVVERAQDTCDGEEPTALQVIHACVSPAAPSLQAALHAVGLDPLDLAADAASAANHEAGTRDPTRTPVLLWSVLNLFLTLASTLLVVRSALDSGVWKFGLLVPVWWGYPGFPPAVGAGVAAILGLVVSPAAAGVHIASVGTEVLQARAEREAFVAETGLRLPLGRFRRHVLRHAAYRGLRSARGPYLATEVVRSRKSKSRLNDLVAQVSSEWGVPYERVERDVRHAVGHARYAGRQRAGGATTEALLDGLIESSSAVRSFLRKCGVENPQPAASSDAPAASPIPLEGIPPGPATKAALQTAFAEVKDGADLDALALFVSLVRTDLGAGEVLKRLGVTADLVEETLASEASTA